MRPGRATVTAETIGLPESPTEQMLRAAQPAMIEEPAEEAAIDPVRPWEPKGEKQAAPEETVVGDPDLRFSDPPPKTAGGTPPGTRHKFSRFDIDRS